MCKSALPLLCREQAEAGARSGRGRGAQGARGFSAEIAQACQRAR